MSRPCLFITVCLSFFPGRAEYRWIASPTLTIASRGSWRRSTCPCLQKRPAAGRRDATTSSASTPFTDRSRESWSSAASTSKNTVCFCRDRSRARFAPQEQSDSLQGVVVVHNPEMAEVESQPALYEAQRLNPHFDLGLQTVGIFRVGSSRKRVRQV